MSESLLSYFEQELRFIREESGAFADKHPGAANALGLNKESVDDPQVSRLIESVALLNGRLQKRLDETFPEFTQSLLRLLFPHYLRPVPSYSILNVVLGDDATACHTIPKGTEFDIQDGAGHQAVFRTTQELDLFPIEISDLSVSMAPFDIPKPAGAEHAKALVELTLSAFDEGAVFSEFDMTALEISLQGDPNLVLRLHDLLFSGIAQVCVSSQGVTQTLGKESLQVSGFETGQATLPYQASSFKGFKLLTEFFVFPERFHALRIDFGKALENIQGSSVTIQLFLDDLTIDLARGLNTSNFSLFCTPIVNLQSVVAEPTIINFLQESYPLVLDAGNQHGLELFAITQVEDIEANRSTPVPQIYSEKYAMSDAGLRWQLIQKHYQNGDQESRLKVADLTNKSAASEPRTWLVNALCTNGTQAAKLHTTSEINCRESITIPGELRMTRRPSLPAKNSDLEQNSWALLSHLHFNYHAILGAEDPVANLKSLFKLYNHHDSPQINAYIASIVAIGQDQIVAPIRVSGKSCFAYGTRLTVTLNSSEVGAGIELFSNLLDRFFACFAGFNSFTQVEIEIEGQEGTYKSFPRRSGCKNLL